MNTDTKKTLINMADVFAEDILRIVPPTEPADSPWQERYGGNLVVADNFGIPYFATRVGKNFDLIPRPKARKYVHFSHEKAERLGSNLGHLSSWQTRDVSNFLYGGAIRLFGHIFSFSGLPESGDDAEVILLARYWAVKMLGKKKNEVDAQVSELIEISDNFELWQMLRHLP